MMMVKILSSSITSEAEAVAILSTLAEITGINGVISTRQNYRYVVTTIRAQTANLIAVT